ncbi:hypothetical protein V6N13_113932 [Hibiscus sabdariffa]|uniref:Uncharacterized protein n=1 Tax=Hibiscus sabdariffa TaxID=183260 RepID=A0ABR2U0A8_9ROSI
MASFASFVEEVGLFHLPKKGKTFTWFGAGLKPGVSDHAPVRLSSGILDWGLKPFCFFNCWLERKGHVKLMEVE